MKPEIIIAVSVGTVIMFFVMLLCRKFYNYLKIWQLAVFAPLLTVAGTLGAYLLYFVENGKFGGISFYGSVFLIPVLFIIVAAAFRVDYGKLLDYCAPSVCVMLAINKINCVRTGCCKGMILSVSENGDAVRFPSQIVELVTVLLIMAALLVLIKKKKFTKLIYPAFMLIYGITRFALNLLRDTTPFVLGLSAGCFWSLIAIVIAVIWISVYKLIQKKKTA